MKTKNFLPNKLKSPKVILASFAFVFSVFFVSLSTVQEAYAGNQCGLGDDKVITKFDLGCNQAHRNPIIDLAFAFTRFLSYGVGIVVIASIVFAGVQYTTAEGNPEKSAQAKSRIQTSIIALIIYLFIFALVQYLVPGGLF